MYVTRENHEGFRCAGVAEDIEQNIGSTPVGHPIFSVHHQGFAEEGEHTLDGFNQFYTEHGRRRHHNDSVFAHHILLEFGQRFPVQQAGRPRPIKLASPSAGAGIQHHHFR